MDVELILTILLAFVFIPLHLSFSRKLQRHVKDKYPEEWENVSANQMKMNIQTIRPVALNDSLKYGFLSQQNDPVLIQYLKFEKSSNFIGVTLVIACILFTLFQ